MASKTSLLRCVNFEGDAGSPVQAIGGGRDIAIVKHERTLGDTLSLKLKLRKRANKVEIIAISNSASFSSMPQDPFLLPICKANFGPQLQSQQTLPAEEEEGVGEPAPSKSCVLA
eukprot:c45642_g1_i1 orf=84-428(+)